MPSPSGSTSKYGFPYLLETDQPDVATASQDLAQAVETEMTLVVPVGFVGEWYSNTAPTQTLGGNPVWLFLHGQTVSGGATLYPALAAQYPSWVSSGNIVLPDTRDRFTVGAGTSYGVGTTGGANSATLTAANIPAFSTSGGGAAAVAVTDAHAHVQAPQTAVSTGSTVGLVTTATNQAAFSNAFSTASTSGYTGISFGSGSPTAVSTLPKYIAAHKIVRAQ